MIPKLVDMAHRWQIVVVAPQYRKAPEVKQPRGYEDVRAVFKHMHFNSSKYGINPGKMVLGGISGGGYESLGAAKIMAKNNE